ncbi:hypothetical protein GLOIN_2v1786104 [Rhizophagus irregularis DAOM 181602=DAOM 197198]|nr:hypothetical protein GLOIN_2v1786104 [Rhizophagus irregularis DAOM 181602=DAOM 197198]
MQNTKLLTGHGKCILEMRKVCLPWLWLHETKIDNTLLIMKRLIIGCTFVDLQSLTNGNKVTVKALIDPKSQYNSISVMLARKLDLYITRVDGSAYPAVVDLGKGTTNADDQSDFESVSNFSKNNQHLAGMKNYFGVRLTYISDGEVKITKFSEHNADEKKHDFYGKPSWTKLSGIRRVKNQAWIDKMLHRA